jgi:thymidylate synthase (FAD)
MPIDSKLYDYHNVLDHGFVKLVDMMGDEKAIINAARVSYANHDDYADREMLPKDVKLLKRLYSDRHTSPFEMAEIKLHIKMPIVTEIQWLRHRTWNFSFQSYRYVPAPDTDADYVPTHLSWRLQHDSNKQMSSETRLASDIGSRLTEAMYSHIESSTALYKYALSHGVAREQARLFLPAYALYTEGYLKVDIHNLLNFLRLRNHEHAQHEIRVYANCIQENILKVAFPTIYEMLTS